MVGSEWRRGVPTARLTWKSVSWTMDREFQRIGSTTCSVRVRLQRKRDWVSVSPSAWRLLKRTGVASGFTRMSPVQSSFAFRFHPNRPNARDHEYVDGLRHRLP